jgi:DNA-binding transcriptional regulator YiaG
MSGSHPAYWGQAGAYTHRYSPSAELVHRITEDSSLLNLIEGTSTIPVAPVWDVLLQAIVAYLRAGAMVYVDESFGYPTPLVYVSNHLISHVTQPTPIATTVTSAVPATSSELIRHLHSESGLTWEQVSKLVGVSRRAVHSWANGTHISAANYERLNRLNELLIDDHPNLSPEERRQMVFSRGASGRSLFNELRRQYAPKGKAVTDAYWTAEEQLLALGGNGET